jgi:hypothetical protein
MCHDMASITPRRCWPPNLRHLATFCGQCSCGCPEVFVDDAAPAERQVIVTDDLGHRVEMSLDQFGDLVEQAKTGRLDAAALAGSS